VATTCPRQLGRERPEDVVQRLGDDDVVVDGHETVQHDVPDTNTYNSHRLLLTTYLLTYLLS